MSSSPDPVPPAVLKALTIAGLPGPTSFALVSEGPGWGGFQAQVGEAWVEVRIGAPGEFEPVFLRGRAVCELLKASFAVPVRDTYQCFSPPAFPYGVALLSAPRGEIAQAFADRDAAFAALREVIDGLALVEADGVGFEVGPGGFATEPNAREAMWARVELMDSVLAGLPPVLRVERLLSELRELIGSVEPGACAAFHGMLSLLSVRVDDDGVLSELENPEQVMLGDPALSWGGVLVYHPHELSRLPPGPVPDTERLRLAVRFCVLHELCAHVATAAALEPAHRAGWFSWAQHRIDHAVALDVDQALREEVPPVAAPPTGAVAARLGEALSSAPWLTALHLPLLLSVAGGRQLGLDEAAQLALLDQVGRQRFRQARIAGPSTASSGPSAEVARWTMSQLLTRPSGWVEAEAEAWVARCANTVLGSEGEEILAWIAGPEPLPSPALARAVLPWMERSPMALAWAAADAALGLETDEILARLEERLPRNADLS